MGIKKKAADDLDAMFAAFIASTTPNRNKQRKYMAQIRDRSGEWLANFDAQEAEAIANFQSEKQAVLDALPPPSLSTVDPNA